MPVFVKTLRLVLDPIEQRLVQNNGVKGNSIGNEIFEIVMMKNLFFEKSKQTKKVKLILKKKSCHSERSLCKN